MLYLSFLLQQLNPHVMHTSRWQSTKTCPARIEIIENQEKITSDRTWLGSGEEIIDKLKDTSIEAGTVIFISDFRSDKCNSIRHINATFILADCSLATLYNIVNNSLCQIRLWTDQLCNAADQSLYNTLSLSAQFVSAPIVLLNPDYRIILSSKLEESKFLTEQLADSGALSEDLVNNIFGKDSEEHSPLKYSIPGKNISLFGQRLYHDKKLISILIIEDDADRTGIDFWGLCDATGKALYRHIIPTNSLRLGTYTMKFQKFWQEIMSQKLTQSVEIIKALEELPFPTDNFISVIVVAFEEQNAEHTPYSFVLAQLRDVFPDCNMTVYENEIVILRTYCERCFRQDLDTEKLSSILEKHNCYIGISNGTRDYGNLRSLYILSKHTIVLASKLRQKPDERIFFNEEYWVYAAIDMCAHRFYELHHHDDIVYMIHPAIIHITRYDKQHNTNLRDTLFSYLLNDRNLVKTAAETFAHRNTVLNKVNKINKLICLDLEDGNLRQRLIFSCQVIMYFEKYMQKKLRI